MEKPSRVEVLVLTTYQTNTPESIIAHQNDVVCALLPKRWLFVQHLYKPEIDDFSPHGRAVDRYLRGVHAKFVVVLDSDCIPLREESFLRLYHYASKGALVGCAQRSNHLDNDSHIYAAPACLMFRMVEYNKFGRPSFCKGNTWDVGEHLTFMWQDGGGELVLLYPSSCEEKKWTLTGTQVYGLGTTYSDLFYHAFQGAQIETENRFVKKCTEVMARIHA